MEKKLRRIKKIIGGILLGSTTGTAVVSVVACSFNEEVAVNQNLQADLDKIEPDLDFFDNLPQPPEHTHWEYQLAAGGFSLSKPNLTLPGVPVDVRLGADDGYELKNGVARSVVLESPVAVAPKLKEEIKAVVLDVNQGILNIPPTTPVNSHWEYRVGDGEFSKTLPAKLTVGEQVEMKLTGDQNLPPGETSDAHWEYSTNGGKTWTRSIPPEGTEEMEVRFVASVNYAVDNKINRVITVTEKLTLPPGLEQSLDNVVADTKSMITNLPPAPEHTFWEYQVNAGAFQKEPPVNLQAEDNLALRLESAENYSFDGTVARKNIIVTGILNPTDIQAELDKVVINTAAEAVVLPPAPDHTHWLYSRDDGITYAEKAPLPSTLNPGDHLAVRLVTANNYRLAVPVERAAIPIIGTVLTTDLRAQLAAVSVNNTNSEIPNLPTAPDHTHWEYRIGDGDYTPTKPNPQQLQPGEQLAIRLVVEKNYVLDHPEPVERTGIVVTGTVDNDTALVEKLRAIKINNRDAAISGLPKAPANAHWEYAVNTEPFSQKQPDPQELAPGDKVGIKLVANDNYVLPEPVENLNIRVQETVHVDQNLLGLLQKIVLNTADATISDLPLAPNHTHWEYAVNGGAYGPNEPHLGALAPGDQVSIKLVANQNYVLDYPAVSRTDINVWGTVVPPASLQAQLAQVAINTAQETITNLPDAPTNTHWEYRIGNGEYRANELDLNQLTPGAQISIKLAPNENYVFESDLVIEKTGIIVEGTVVQPEGLQTELDQVTIDKGGEGITNLPPAPDHSHWEYQVASGAYTPNKPTSEQLKLGQKVSIKLVADPNYVLAGDAPAARSQIVVEEVLTPDATLADTLQTVTIENWKSEITNLPTAPDHTHWEYRIGDDSFRADSPELKNLEPGTGVAIKLVADENYVLSTPELFAKSNVVVQGQVANNANLIAEVNGIEILNNADTINKLPVAPVNSHWEYAIDGGEFSATVPDFPNLAPGQKIQLQLVANENYVLAENENVTSDVLTVKELIDVTEYSQALQKTTVESGTDWEFQNFPTMPVNTNLEYKVDDGDFSTTPPSNLANFKPGTRISFRLVPLENYVLSAKVEQTIFVADSEDGKPWNPDAETF